MKCQESLVLYKVSGNSLSKQVENLQVRNVLPQAIPQKHEKPSSQMERAALGHLLCGDPAGFALAGVSRAAEVPPFSEIVTFLILRFHSRHRKTNLPCGQATEDQGSS